MSLGASEAMRLSDEPVRSGRMLPQARRVEFGYNPPSGTRGIEHFRARSSAICRRLDVASQALPRSVADHLMTVEPFRMDVWTQLTWIAARIGPPARSSGQLYRHPP
jgi:hypothetical protein